MVRDGPCECCSSFWRSPEKICRNDMMKTGCKPNERIQTCKIFLLVSLSMMWDGSCECHTSLWFLFLKSNSLIAGVKIRCFRSSCSFWSFKMSSFSSFTWIRPHSHTRIQIPLHLVSTTQSHAHTTGIQHTHIELGSMHMIRCQTTSVSPANIPSAKEFNEEHKGALQARTSLAGQNAPCTRPAG